MGPRADLCYGLETNDQAIGDAKLMGDRKLMTGAGRWAALRWPVMELLDRTPSEPAPEGDGPLQGGPADRRGPGRWGSSPQERLESSRVGRWLLSALLVATLSAVMVWNLPESEIRETALPVVEPFVNIAGLDQQWNLFAPNPPRRTFEVVARIEYANGELVLWRSPRNDRWRKWLGVIRNERSRRLWEPTAAWIAGHHDDGGRQVERVELIVRAHDLPAPGSGLPDPPWQEDIFFTYDVPGSDGS